MSRNPGGRLQLTALSTRIGWERSRVSHHLQRMGKRGLVQLVPSTGDGRATDALLTDTGRAALLAATPGHAQLVRQMFFDGLDPALLRPLRVALEQVHEQVLRIGTLPRPTRYQHRLPGSQPDASSGPSS